MNIICRSFSHSIWPEPHTHTDLMKGELKNIICRSFSSYSIWPEPHTHTHTHTHTDLMRGELMNTICHSSPAIAPDLNHTHWHNVRWADKHHLSLLLHPKRLTWTTHTLSWWGVSWWTSPPVSAWWTQRIVLRMRRKSVARCTTYECTLKNPRQQKQTLSRTNLGKVPPMSKFHQNW